MQFNGLWKKDEMTNKGKKKKTLLKIDQCERTDTTQEGLPLPVQELASITLLR